MGTPVCLPGNRLPTLVDNVHGMGKAEEAAVARATQHVWLFLWFPPARLWAAANLVLLHLRLMHNMRLPAWQQPRGWAKPLVCATTSYTRRWRP